MTLSRAEKTGIIEKHRRKAADSGSPEVQVALITARLKYLQGHFEQHRMDFHSRRGLLRLVGKRRRLLEYLRRQDVNRYRTLISELDIRK